MLQTKFQGHWSTGSGEEGFFKVSTIYWHGGRIDHVTVTDCTYIFIPSVPGGSTRNLVTFDPLALEEMFEIVRL